MTRARAIGFSLLLFFSVIALGCACKERYAPFLKQVRDNLANDIRPKYAKALKESGRPADLMANDLGLVDDTVSSIDRVLSDGPAVIEEGGGE